MRYILAAMVVCMLLVGCFGTAPEQPENITEEEETPPVDETEEPEDDEPVVTGDGTIIEAPSGPGGDEEPPDYTGPPATSQQDCATMTPDCESCISKQGCGWCKSSNSCFLGTASGPTVSSCPPDEWTVTESGCSVVDEGESCSDFTNCAFCLSGSGCKWCIQGSVCVSESSSEECFGGWLTESYQCNYASR